MASRVDHDWIESQARQAQAACDRARKYGEAHRLMYIDAAFALEMFRLALIGLDATTAPPEPPQVDAGRCEACGGGGNIPAMNGTMIVVCPKCSGTGRKGGT